ncbi:proliferating cell nuclear antigen (pcna) [Nanoarchaeota archaeon NZ13-N]|uniref:DNA polymerase sliding clamp n=1 Tax=Candidatus Nanoclepta minutus TaxID=1940235 RepID=A0A397WQ99_9ARCH|nr:MAG: proliferating cell nuclear antigen (pcna) [Nanoarchaeota archaeon NZ13-N]RIB35669.1 MAG: proliferating cell nuclear antigen (pcna) [Candidatus Nanoclepta minutus]
MEVVFPQAKELRSILSAATAFLSEGTFKAKNDGIFLASLDSANVAVIIVDMYPNMFLDYKIDGEEEIFTVNLEDLKKILSKAKTKEQISWKTDKKKNKFILSIKGKSTRSFTLPLIETEGNVLDIPSLDLRIKLEMDAKAFSEIVSSAKVIADELKITTDPDKNTISFIAEGELKDMRIDLTSQDEGVLSMEVPEKVTVRYSVDYLYKITKVATISDTVMIKFDQDKPIWLDYRSLDKFRFGFVLAPRE